MISPQKSPDKETMTSACEICKKNVEDDDKAVACDCDRTKWFHIKCVSITTKQYNNMMTGTYPLNWICNDCGNIKLQNQQAVKHSDKSLTPSQASTGTSPEHNDKIKQFETIVDLLMKDIQNLKDQLADEKAQNLKLSDIITTKMEVIYNLEQTIHDLIKTDNSINDKQLGLGPDPTKPKQTQKQPAPEPQTESQHPHSQQNYPKHNAIKESAKLLLLGDSIIRGAGKILKEQYRDEIHIEMVPGAKIAYFSNFISSLEQIPEQVVFNVGTNNIQFSKTINHIVRPLWLTIEAATKNFKGLKCYVNSILYRDDIRDRYIRELNEALKDMCTQLGAIFVDITSEFTTECYAGDGIHPSMKGDQLLAKTIAKETGLGLNKTETTITDTKELESDPVENELPDNTPSIIPA